MLSNGRIETSVLSVCRLCISLFTESCFPINEVNVLLNNVFPNLDLTSTNNPVVCTSCVNGLTYACQFKNMCMEKEKKIQEYYDKTKKTVDLYAFVESELDTILNIPKSSFKNLCEMPMKNIHMVTTEGQENKYSIVQESFVRNQSEVTLKSIVKINELSDDNVIEILESDINSDVELDVPKDCDSNDNSESGRHGSETVTTHMNIEKLILNSVDINDHSFIKVEPETLLSCSATSDIVEESKQDKLHKSLESESFNKTPKGAETKHANRLQQKINYNLFRCVLCYKMFNQKLHLNGHLLTKHKDIPNIEEKVDSKIHYCQYCSYRSVSNCSVARHLVKIHKKKSSMYKYKFKKFYCAHCEYSTENKGNLIIHVRTHNAVRTFQCDFCERSSNQKGVRRDTTKTDSP